MKKILTFGVFDLLHIGHVLLFKNAKEYGSSNNFLIVAVQETDYIQKYKPNAEMVYSQNERIFMVGSLKYVDNVITYKDIDQDIKKIDFDILAKGPDQNHEGFVKAVDWCLKNGKQVITIPRTDGISSTDIREFKKLK